MTEKKLVVDGIRFTYNGMFEIDEFFGELDGWTEKNGFEREVKNKLEHVEEHGKKMQYTFELWKQVEDWARVVVRIKALFRDVQEFDMVRGHHKRNMQKGKVLVIIDGFLETDLEYRWTEKPWYVFIRTLYDKLIWKFWLSRHDGSVAAPCNDLLKRMFNFFKRYKY